jgi:alanyl-tRNA synthetase
MNAQEVRKKYLEFMARQDHVVVPRANIVPDGDPTTLFTGSGMQPMVPYLLGEPHPEGRRLTDSQTCIRAQDIDEVGDTSHTTFFEMLGNWSLGDYFKEQQIRWFWEFLITELKLDPHKIYVSCFAGDEKLGIPRDEEAANVWQGLFEASGVEAKIIDIGSAENGDRDGMQGGRIFYYDAKENWWSRAGTPESMPVGEPGGPDSEVFYDFGEAYHDLSFGQPHPASDSPRFMEIGNSVFMQYIKTESGFDELRHKNIDFGGGLERLAAATIDSPDVYRTSLLWPIVEKLMELTDTAYEGKESAMRIIADHVRGATFMAVDGVRPSNTAQGYVMRRLIRRAIRGGLELGVQSGLIASIVPVVIDIYKDDYVEVVERAKDVLNVLQAEEEAFRKTLERGLREFEKRTSELDFSQRPPVPTGKRTKLTGKLIFQLSDTYGFPVELSLEEAEKEAVVVASDWREEFDRLLDEQKERSRTATAGQFKGGLADHSAKTVQYHTATHLMYRALRNVLGDHVMQRGSNITPERLRFDFSHSEKMTPEQIAEVERIVNDVIKRNLSVSFAEMSKDKAFEAGALGAFGEKYPDIVKVYTVGDADGDWYSREICGGPHVPRTGELGKFRIIKEESSSAGVRRIKAVLE